MVDASPAAKAALSQARSLWPDRPRASDGILPSAAHTITNPKSNHERGNAVDLTVGGGFDGDEQFERLRRRAMGGLEPRVTELIHNRRIATRARLWTVRPYTGSNPHTSHLHISIDPAHRGDTSPWWVDPGPSRTAALEDDVPLTDADADKVARRVIALLELPSTRPTLGVRTDRTYKLAKLLAEKLGVDWKQAEK